MGPLRGEVTRTRCIALIVTLQLTSWPCVLNLEGPLRCFPIVLEVLANSENDQAPPQSER